MSIAGFRMDSRQVDLMSFPGVVLMRHLAAPRAFLARVYVLGTKKCTGEPPAGEM